MKLFEELKRRNVFRVGIAYLVAAWVLLQVFDVVGEILELPAWGGKLILAVLVVGFFISLIVAWAYELTPEGVKRDSEVEEGSSYAAQTSHKLNTLIMTLLLVAVAYLLFDKFWLQPRIQVNSPTLATEPASADKTAKTTGTEPSKTNPAADKSLSIYRCVAI